METTETIYGPVAKRFYRSVIIAYALAGLYAYHGHLGEHLLLWFGDLLRFYTGMFSAAVAAGFLIDTAGSSGLRRYRSVFCGVAFGLIAVIGGLVPTPPGNAMLFLHVSALCLVGFGCMFGLLVFEVLERSREPES